MHSDHAYLVIVLHWTRNFCHVLRRFSVIQSVLILPCWVLGIFFLISEIEFSIWAYRHHHSSPGISPAICGHGAVGVQILVNCRTETLHWLMPRGKVTLTVFGCWWKVGPTKKRKTACVTYDKSKSMAWFCVFFAKELHFCGLLLVCRCRLHHDAWRARSLFLRIRSLFYESVGTFSLLKLHRLFL